MAPVSITEDAITLLAKEYKVSNNQRPQNNSIPAKHFKIIIFNVSYQEANRYEGNYKSSHHTSKQYSNLRSCKMEAKLPKL